MVYLNLAAPEGGASGQPLGGEGSAWGYLLWPREFAGNPHPGPRGQPERDSACGVLAGRPEDLPGEPLIGNLAWAAWRAWSPRCRASTTPAAMCTTTISRCWPRWIWAAGVPGPAGQQRRDAAAPPPGGRSVPPLYAAGWSGHAGPPRAVEAVGPSAPIRRWPCCCWL